MMYPAKDRKRNNVSEPLHRACARRVLPERNVRSHLVIIGGIFRKDSSKVLRVEHDQMTSALAPDRPDQAFSISVLPRRGLSIRATQSSLRIIGLYQRDDILDLPSPCSSCVALCLQLGRCQYRQST